MSDIIINAQELQKAESLIHKYVAVEKKWPADDYYIEVASKKSGSNEVKFKVVYREDLNSPLLGGGKSFSITIDMRTMQILNVLRYQ